MSRWDGRVNPHVENSNRVIQADCIKYGWPIVAAATMIPNVAIPEDSKAWVRSQVERLRNDPKGWTREQGERLKKVIDVAPFSDEVLERELAVLREAVARLPELSADERVATHDALINLHERLTASGAMVSGAKIGLAAAALPVLGLVTGPLLGGAYGVYRSRRLSEVRNEVKQLLHTVVRGDSPT